MAKKLNISSIFKKRETGSSSSSSATTTWQWPSCTHSKTHSFRADDNIFKTMNSIFFDPFDGTESPASISTDQETFETEPLEMLIKGVKSERLFFEPGNNTSAILQKQEQEQENGDEDELPFKESIVLAMESKNPYWDFKKSMKEMVESEGIKDWEYLQELLTWYLKMNGKINHRFILSAFVDLIVEFAATILSLSCPDSSEMGTGACRILQKQCIFEVPDTGAATVLKSSGNIALSPSSVSDSITFYNSSVASSSFSCPSSPLSFLGHNNDKEIEELEN